MKAYQGYTCPKCDGTMTVLHTGRANKGRYIVRARKCIDCGFRAITAESIIHKTEGQSSVLPFDEEQMFARKLKRRSKHGYHGFENMSHPKSPRMIHVDTKLGSGGEYLCNHDHSKDV